MLCVNNEVVCTEAGFYSVLYALPWTSVPSSPTALQLVLLWIEVTATTSHPPHVTFDAITLWNHHKIRTRIFLRLHTRRPLDLARRQNSRAPLGQVVILRTHASSTDGDFLETELRPSLEVDPRICTAESSNFRLFQTYRL
jgi:hypothetical protein